MPGQLRAYSYINAKLRARIGEMLADDDFRRLAQAASVDDAVTELDGLGFGDVAEAYRNTGDVRMCEQELYRREIETLLDIERHLDGVRRHFVVLLGDRYEIENLKTALRLWFEGFVRGRHVEQKIAYLSRGTVHRDINLDAVVNAASARAIPEVLAGTPYQQPVADELERVQTRGSLFPLERALDAAYVSRLLEGAAALSRPDGEAARSFIALDVDRENVSWVVRAVGYYRLSEQEAIAGVLPGGASVDTRSLTAAVRSGDPAGALLEHFGTASMSRGHDGGRQAQALELIETALEEEMNHLVHRYLGSYPFTMGMVLAYTVLAHRQLRRISTVLNGLAYGLDLHQVEGAL